MYLFLYAQIVMVEIPTKEREKPHNIFAQNVGSNLMKQFINRWMNLFQVFMKTKKQLKFEISALYQRTNGEISITYQI